MNLLEHRVLGFRTLDLALSVLLVALILGVYLAKTLAGGERGQIASTERQITEEKDRIVLLEAEVAHLERPERLASLARTYAGLSPVASNREITPQGLADALQSPAAPAPQLLVVGSSSMAGLAEAESSALEAESTAPPSDKEPEP
ncbi:cell division protein [Phenylobacterium sp.]|uniref:cell division protein FtsL n=1 Tax=Phenylobacterium sp. TaxID=1871053 RepID=UPI0025D94751|nr:cell division protein [Phenylobacterium sp.]MCA6286532.1 cell division protein [Phenylobacterium sp.]MCA6289552.1 cell division protein [Phenylobacterium sp.]MCA6310736.1 cell division protein [Phenylobacterium sp.]MCA6323883.1 cell division protein [Phenylobacterium sp.]MCA6336339.1 cell division protein [Phenylobacterium sp.]